MNSPEKHDDLRQPQEDATPVLRNAAKRNSNGFTNPRESSGKLIRSKPEVSHRRMGRQWTLAGVLVGVGVTVALTALSSPTWALLLVVVGALLCGAALGALVFRQKTVTITSVYAQPFRPFPAGETSHFRKEREMLSKDNADFIASFGPDLRASAYDNAMMELDFLVRERGQAAESVVGMQDNEVVAKTVREFYIGWLNLTNQHYSQRQEEDSDERRGLPVNQSRAFELEDKVGALLETARRTISAEDQKLVHPE